MHKYMKIVFEIKSAMKCNMLIYYLQKLPIVGYKWGNFLFRNTMLKNLVSIIVTILSVIAISIIKLACVLIFILFPMTWYISERGIAIDDYSLYYMQAIFFFFCILGSFQESRTFLISKVKYVCLTCFKMKVKECITAFLMIEYLLQFISILIVFAVCNQYLLNNIWYFIALTVEYISLQFFSETLHLVVFKKTSIPLEKNKLFSVILMGIAVAGAYGPLLFSSKCFIISTITNSGFVLLVAMGGMASIYYIVFVYNGYNYKLARTFRQEDLMEEISKKTQISMNSVEIEFSKEQSLGLDQSLSGYNLLNRLFMKRNLKSLRKYLRWRIVFIVAATIICVISFMNNYEATRLILKKITLFVPLLPIVLCFLAYGEGYCKFSYHNCDSKLLPYSFYRTRGAILKNYYIRLNEITKRNVLLGGIIIAAFLVLMYIGAISVLTYEILLLFGTILCLIIVFGIHHLSLYYLLQPYILESTIQNPVSFMVQMPMILLAYLLMLLQMNPISNMLFLIGGGVVYSTVLVFLVNIKGARTFRLK